MPVSSFILHDLKAGEKPDLRADALQDTVVLQEFIKRCNLLGESSQHSVVCSVLHSELHSELRGDSRGELHMNHISQHTVHQSRHGTGQRVTKLQLYND